MQQNFIAITATTPAKEHKAKELAGMLKLNFIPYEDKASIHSYVYLLIITEDRIGLQNMADRSKTPFYLDFLSKKMIYRCERATLRNELLARAIGVKPSDHATIIDGTAGFGRDSFILASLGYQITLLERSPIIHLILQDALSRISHIDTYQRLTLIHADTIHWLPRTKYPNIILLDPMFPDKKKSSSVKKESAILQDLLVKCRDDEYLLMTALACATERVVVKRPRLAECLAKQKPSFSLKGNSCRFDIYLV